MKRNKDWTDEVRSELRDAELTPPGDGWERLRRELAQADAGANAAAGLPPRTSAVRLYWPRIAAAAAVVLLCVATGEILWRADSEPGRDGSVITTAADGGNAAEHKSEAAASDRKSFPAEASERSRARESVLAEASESSPVRESLLARASEPKVRQRASYGGITPPASGAATPSGVQSASVELSAAEPRAPEPGREHSVSEQTPANDASSTPSGVQRHRKSVSPVAALPETPFVTYTPPRKSTSFGLFAGGGVAGGKTDGSPSSGMLMSNNAHSGESEVTSLRRPDYGEESYRHHLPLSFGLSVRKEFAHGLSLETGVNYTLLRSDVRLLYSSEDISQRLHFIGVPLRMNWTFLQRGGFSLYIGAGGMVEKCVSAELGSRSVKQTGVQWSVFGAAGAEYRFAGPVGLYFEPEASYYFTQTALRTARTDAPLTLTLRLGVRFSF